MFIALVPEFVSTDRVEEQELIPSWRHINILHRRGLGSSYILSWFVSKDQTDGQGLEPSSNLHEGEAGDREDKGKMLIRDTIRFLTLPSLREAATSFPSPASWSLVGLSLPAGAAIRRGIATAGSASPSAGLQEFRAPAASRRLLASSLRQLLFGMLCLWVMSGATGRWSRGSLAAIGAMLIGDDGAGGVPAPADGHYL
jgi:hypothetical protein